MNPRLIYASISGYGQTGPQKSKGGFDLVAQGVSGIMSVTGEPGGAPVKSGIPLTDLGAGALRDSRHPRGAREPAQDRARPAGRHLAARCGRRPVGLGGDAVLLGTRHSRAPRFGASHERALPGVPLRRRLHHDRRRQRSHVPSDLRGAWPSGVARHAGVQDRRRCASAIAPISPGGSRPSRAREPRAHWLELFDANNIPCGPINDYSQVFEDPQVIARELVVDVEHPDAGRDQGARLADQAERHAA